MKKIPIFWIALLLGNSVSTLLFSAEASETNCARVFSIYDPFDSSAHEDRRKVIIKPPALRGKQEVLDPFLNLPLSLQNPDFPFVMDLRQRFRTRVRTLLETVKWKIEDHHLDIPGAQKFLETWYAGNLNSMIGEAYALIAWAAIHNENPEDFFQGAVHGFNNMLNVVSGRIEELKVYVGDRSTYLGKLSVLSDSYTIQSERRLITGIANPSQAAAQKLLGGVPKLSVGTIDAEGTILEDVYFEKPDVPALSLRDWDALALALEELLWNAFKYSEGTPVKLYAHKEKYQFTVENGGRGIPDGFDPFVPGERGDQTDKPGTGYGLSSVVSVLESIGWEVVLESRRAPTRFVVRKKG